jgi:hypothetical protein
MKLGKVVGSALSLGLLLVAGVASAQEAPAAVPTAGSDGHASGVMVQARLLANSGLLSLGGGPGFLIGYQGPSFAVGLGLGLNRVSASSGDESANATLFQIMPTALFDVWQSKDGRAHANLIAGVGYGHGSIGGTESTQTCVPNASGVGETCTSSKRDFSTGIGFVPFMLGFGGDYYLSRNFALGADVGLQAAISTGIDNKSGATSRSIDGSGNLQMAYGALRATFVMGD